MNRAELQKLEETVSNRYEIKIQKKNQQHKNSIMNQTL